MLYICKDLGSKRFDWRGVGRGGRMETSECLKLTKSPVSSRLRKRTSRLRLRSVTRRSAPDFRFVKERLPDRRTSALAYQQSFSHLDKLGVCDSGHS